MSEASIHSITQSSSTQSKKVEGNANPTKEIARRHVWKKAHTKKDDDTISDATSSYFGKTAKAKKPINDGDEEDLSLDEDILPQVFGNNKRGRTRTIGTKISRNKVKASTIARKQIKRARGDPEELKVRLENMESTLNMLIDLVKRYVGQKNRIPDIVSNIEGSNTRQEIVGKMLNNDVVDQLNSSSAASRKCEILNLDLEVIATGFVCRDSTTSIMHGKPIPPTHEKLVVDNILLPDWKTTKLNHPFAVTFAEVGIGGCVCHPKCLIRYL